MIYAITLQLLPQLRKRLLSGFGTPDNIRGYNPSGGFDLAVTGQSATFFPNHWRALPQRKPLKS